MFSRIREAHRILTYREPDDGSTVIVERSPMQPTIAGKRIGNLFEMLIVVYGIGWIAAHVGEPLFRYIPFTHFTSTSVFVGSIAAFFLMLAHWLRDDLQQKFRAHIHVEDTLAPYFGERLHRAYSVLKGTGRVS
jgi:hypothetical protein